VSIRSDLQHADPVLRRVLLTLLREVEDCSRRISTLEDEVRRLRAIGPSVNAGPGQSADAGPVAELFGMVGELRNELVALKAARSPR
jgi:uncharacterized small protein (DUF1192 family)